MEIKELKRYIYENNKIDYILENIQMHHIKYHNNSVKPYYSCGMPDGDNPSSTIIYNNEKLKTIANTRDIKDSFGRSDIISLVVFIKKLYITDAIKFICDILGLDYYKSFRIEETEFMKMIRFYENLMNETDEYKDEILNLEPIPSDVLSYYYPVCNSFFKEDGISFETQKEFEIGLDLSSNRITIPIRDDIENGKYLVGVKGRLFKKEINEDEQKYLYLEKCAKSKILFGLNKTKEYILENKSVIVVESEKAVMQLWTNGIYNSVAIGGHQISNVQKTKLVNLGVPIVIAFDKDVEEEDLFNELHKFDDAFVDIFYLYDYDNILNEKQSPTDDFEKFNKLYEKKYIYIKEPTQIISEEEETSSGWDVD